MPTVEIDKVAAACAEMPDDIDSCHAIIRELRVLVAGMNADVVCLKQRLHSILRIKFGRSSERMSPGQISLFAQELDELLGRQNADDSGKSKPGPGSGEGKPAPKKHGGGGRKPHPPSLKRVPRDYFPPEAEMICAGCGLQKIEIGVESLDQLDYVPASFVVIEHITHKFACKPCQEGVVEGIKPPQILNGGKVSEGVIAKISTSKWADHIPLYRQGEIYAREGIDIARSSMGRWLDLSGQAAKPIYTRMGELILEGQVVQVDESPVTFIDKSREVKKSKQGYVWAYFGDETHPYCFYDIQPDRTAARPKEVLRGYSNLLLTDGYGGYEWYPRELSANCNVHFRRYIEKALKYDQRKAGIVMAIINELYKIESRIKGLDAEQILRTREKESRPLMNQINQLLLEWQIETPPKTTLGIAINYALPRWDKLCRFLDHACLKMDTNLVENSIRPVSIGRKNWLHIGAESAMETASIHASLVNTCKRLNINPFLYLRDIFIRRGQGEDSIDDLLKWTLKNPINSMPERQ